MVTNFLSRRPGGYRGNILREYAEKILRVSDRELVKVVEDLLSIDPRRLGRVTEASIRKMHTSIISILDRIIEGRYTQNIYTEIAHAKIFVNYQSARNQLGPAIADAVDYLLTELSNSLSGRIEQAANTARRIRLFLDALVTLTKKST